MCNTHGCGSHGQVSRRTFLVSSAVAAGGALASFSASGATSGRPATGPGRRYVPRIKVAFVRRRGDYGMSWPGAIYDGAAALKNYTEQVYAAAREFSVEAAIRTEPSYSLAEGKAWIAQAEAEKADGLLLILLDRQEHAWPTAALAVASPAPSVIFAPIGAAFTTNTAPLAGKTGSVIYSTDDFRQAVYGIKMIAAAARLRETRFVVIAGNERKLVVVPHFGTALQYVPASSFLELYNDTPVNDEVRALANEYIDGAQQVTGATPDDVVNGVKSYIVARTILEREGADAISMDCLGALGKTKVSLPCIAWSRMLDTGIPAACEADLGACITHALVMYLFDRPGFQQDPVPDTANDCLIGAHCTCPTRLAGFSEAPEPFRLSHHHGNRDAVPVPRWKEGQRATVACIGLPQSAEAKPSMVISAGSVHENISVPPSGGCVVSVSLKLDGNPPLLSYPGFHQIFFYGDYKKELADYCQLFGVEAQIV